MAGRWSIDARTRSARRELTSDNPFQFITRLRVAFAKDGKGTRLAVASRLEDQPPSVHASARAPTVSPWTRPLVARISSLYMS